MSIAQTAKQRRTQAAIIKAQLRTAQTAGERLESKLRTYANKKKLIEAKDMQPLLDLYKTYNQAVDAVQKPLTDLMTLVGK